MCLLAMRRSVSPVFLWLLAQRSLSYSLRLLSLCSGASAVFVYVLCAILYIYIYIYIYISYAYAQDTQLADRMRRTSTAKERCLLPKFDNFLGKIAKTMDDLKKLPQLQFQPPPFKVWQLCKQLVEVHDSLHSNLIAMPFCMQISACKFLHTLNCMDVFGQVRSPDWACVVEMWTDQRDIERCECINVRTAVKLMIKQSKDLFCF